ncbi:MAG: hypothetical protein SNJ75_13105 [Gemmataceae bacterium]
MAMWNLCAVLPGWALEGNTLLYGGVAAGVGVALLFMIVIFSRKKKDLSPEAGLEVDLSKLPPVPTGERHYALKLKNHPVRLRLVVVAPMGKRALGKIDALLEEVQAGLGEVLHDDRPVIKQWPPQLSATGFAPTFFRLMIRPDGNAKPSRWVLLAGPARAGAIPILLGMVLQTEGTASNLGLVTMNENQWDEMLSIENP